MEKKKCIINNGTTELLLKINMLSVILKCIIKTMFPLYQMHSTPSLTQLHPDVIRCLGNYIYFLTTSLLKLKRLYV